MSNQSKGRPGGVLPMNTSATKKSSASAKPAQRTPAPRLRLIIRRLPPGLTEDEFWNALGPEWQTGKVKVDWHAYKQGKISKDPAKPSKPGRSYLKVKDQALLEELSAKVKTTSFRDARNTANDPCLVGPPSLEFAPYNKVPSGRNRHDGRQGTIDQDQEFIDFLQGLTEPITRPAVNGSETPDSKQDKAVTTPLVQFIKEKKANKAKEKEAAAAAKSAKKNQESKEGKAKGESRPTVVVKNNATTGDKTRVVKATQEVVKAANKSVTQIQSKATGNKSESKSGKQVAATPTTSTPALIPSSTSASKPERQRGNASAASRMIARDLGLVPKEPRTPRASRNVSNATPSAAGNISKAETPQKATELATAPTSTPAAPAAKPSTTAAVSTPAQTPPTGPKSTRSTPTSQAKSVQPAPQRPSKPSPQPTSGAKSAFLKHANPSQGVTEELLRTTFSLFGGVTRCEIDKKKGLGYVDFTETEALKKAMAASPIKVGNGQVTVLENRSPYQKRQPHSGNTNQQQSGSGAGTPRAPSVASSVVPAAVTSPQPVPAVLSTPESVVAIASPTISSTATEAPNVVEPSGSSPSQPAGTSTPTAPKGARSGNTPARGARGGAAFAAGRGGANPSPNRGRGGFRGRVGRGARAGDNAGTATGASSTPPTSSQPRIQGGGTDGASKQSTGDKS